jgi:predicted TIM-barrel fold metal-dependent hydrolase
MGYERVLYGTDFPWDMGEYDSIDVIKTLDFINEAKKLEILGGNSLDLFKISTG